MLAHEVPYASLDRVEIPTETWPAQDMRKSHVLYVAAKYAEEPLRTACQQKAAFFFDTCLKDLYTFPTRTLTRPLVLLMTTAHTHAYFQQHPDETAPLPRQNDDFGQPTSFTPQFNELYWLRDQVAACIRYLNALSQLTKRIRQ
jgi:hypothetical protein